MLPAAGSHSNSWSSSYTSNKAQTHLPRNALKTYLQAHPIEASLQLSRCVMLATELTRIVTKVFTIFYKSKVLCKKLIYLKSWMSQISSEEVHRMSMGIPSPALPSFLPVLACLQNSDFFILLFSCQSTDWGEHAER